MAQVANDSFGALLRRYRREAGLTQEELAERAGISVRAVSDLERDTARTPRRDTLALLAAALDLTPERRERLRAAARPALAPVMRHNLPVQLTRFIGRGREIDEGRALLDAHRLVTLTGVGGTGKTRLAMAIAERALPGSPDGVAVVELAPLDDPALVPRAVAGVLAASEQPGESLPQALVRSLREHAPLLVLDNCEHLIEACAQLADLLLRACPALRILATSRQPLDVPGEVAWRIDPLALPDAADEADLTALMRSEAVQLFMARAQTARPGFRLTGRNAAPIARICCQLDGIPLALELAAARVRALAPEELAARLDDRFRVLSTGSRTALPRQQTLRATLDWSYRLLDEEERILLQRLGVFAGGWTLEAAEAVCGAASLAAGTIVDLLARLVEKSLVGLDDSGDTARYRLLETVRQYTQERLAETGETDMIQRRHAAWALSLAEGLLPQLLAGAESATLARFGAEDANLGQALAWCRERDAATGLRLCGFVWRYWNSARLWSEGRRRVGELVALDGGAGADRAQALLGLSVMAKNQGDFAASAEAGRASRDLFRALGDRAGEAAAMTNLQIVLVHRLEMVAAGRIAEEALALGREGDDLEVGMALANVTPVLGFLGQFARAEQSLAESVALLRRAGVSETWLVAPYTFQAWFGLWRDDLPAARAALNAAEAVTRAHPHFLDDDHLPTFRADLTLREGDLAAAATLLEATLASLRRTHSTIIFNPLGLLGLARWRLGECDAALAAWREGFALRRAIESNYYAVVLLATFGVGMAEAGEPVAAARLLGAVEALCRASGCDLRTVTRPEHAETVAAIRAALGDGPFALAWAAGESLTLEEAHAEGQALLDRLSSAV